MLLNKGGLQSYTQNNILPAVILHAIFFLNTPPQIQTCDIPKSWKPRVKILSFEVACKCDSSFIRTIIA